MTEILTSLVVGTTAALMATILLLLRAEFHGRRPILALTRRWVATGAPASGLVVTFCCGVAAYSFAPLFAIEGRVFSQSAPMVHGGGAEPAIGPDAQAVDALRNYARTIDDAAAPRGAPPGDTASALPDVESMISKLIARLEKSPDDVRGWKMLGWSYLNTNRPKQAAEAYEKAIAIDPDDIENRKGLEKAKLAQSSTKEVGVD